MRKFLTVLCLLVWIIGMVVALMAEGIDRYRIMGIMNAILILILGALTMSQERGLCIFIMVLLAIGMIYLVYESESIERYRMLAILGLFLIPSQVGLSLRSGTQPNHH